MKKFITFSLALVALFAFAITASAGENCSGTTAKKTDAKASTCSDSKTTATQASSSACTASKTNATHASAKSCTPEQMAACAKAMGMTKEECAKMCADGSHSIQTISIEGMTCGGCENSVKTALQKIEGVKSVISVSHKDKSAVVCIDPTKCESTSLTTAISAKGFQAQIMPAVAKVNSTDAPSGKTCSDAEKKACAAACTDKKAETKTDKTDGSK